MAAAETDDRAEANGGDEDTPLQTVAAGAVTLVTLAVAFGLLALGYPYFWVAFPVGFGGGMPLAVGLARWYESTETAPSGDARGARGETDEALATLRDRYARGELTDEEFEARVERLLETESVSDARATMARGRGAAGVGDADERATNGERAGGGRRAADERRATEEERG
jgi:uncharacterized membrane protein